MTSKLDAVRDGFYGVLDELGLLNRLSPETSQRLIEEMVCLVKDELPNLDEEPA